MYYNKTPLLRRKFDDSKFSPQLFLKYEMLQPSGSFKSRGISYLISKRKSEAEAQGGRKLVVFSSSGGNAGLAAATAAKSMDLECTVVIPKTTKRRMIEKIEKSGATVIIHGDHWGQADAYLREVVMVEEVERGLETLYVHPFDDETIWEGHSTIVDEIVQQLEEHSIAPSRLKGIVCSVGGGGLFSGVVKGLERHKLADKVPVIAVETNGCDVLSKSLESGSPVTLSQISSVATSLGSPFIASFAFESALKYDSKALVLQDKEVLETCLTFADESGIIIEPACGASLHLCYNPKLFDIALGTQHSLAPTDVIVVIACGGSCVSYNDLLELYENKL
ncbi:LAME_0B00254g1_1 [Lachancea meyersii CBS 8951]|uniref:L-serine ammonia-lyase n=1 Tax=Lachancea meyersii CBS 8951 TaxID=1266667 RepID=A0A1G4ISW9_9SACH|nr:LAME_0B00254g1_1 [Lachancea meyersii CBS 8951]